MGLAIAIDIGASAYVTGFTCSDTFPTTLGAYDTSLNSCFDAFVTKLHPTGATLAYSTFLGGNNSDLGFGSAIDAGGSAYVTGQTCSSNFPTTSGAHDTTLNSCSDVFVTKLNPTGATLTYSTFLGGGGADVGRGIAIDASGSAYVTGYTCSSNFPTTFGAHDTSLVNCFDVFVTEAPSNRARRSIAVHQRPSCSRRRPMSTPSVMSTA